MRKLSLVILIFFSLLTKGQMVSVSGSGDVIGCGTKLPPNYVAFKNKIVTQTQNMVDTLTRDICVNKKFSIVFYVVRDSTVPYSYPQSWGGITTANLQAAVDSLNAKFKKICVQFMNCSTVVIHNYVYNNWVTIPHEAQVTSNWYTTQTINIYLVTSMGGGIIAGYTYMPGTPGNKDIIVMRKSALNTKVLYHVIGHFFGLPDTYEEITSPGSPSQEVVARTNCYTNGDGFCDTEADPYPTNWFQGNPLAACWYLYGAQDAQSRYYTPPVDNYMSEYLLFCRCRYTQEQYNFMAKIMLTTRFYLH